MISEKQAFTSSRVVWIIFLGGEREHREASLSPTLVTPSSWPGAMPGPTPSAPSPESSPQPDAGHWGSLDLAWANLTERKATCPRCFWLSEVMINIWFSTLAWTFRTSTWGKRVEWRRGPLIQRGNLGEVLLQAAPCQSPEETSFLHSSRGENENENDQSWWVDGPVSPPCSYSLTPRVSLPFLESGSLLPTGMTFGFQVMRRGCGRLGGWRGLGGSGWRRGVSDMEPWAPWGSAAGPKQHCVPKSYISLESPPIPATGVFMFCNVF